MYDLQNVVPQDVKLEPEFKNVKSATCNEGLPPMNLKSHSGKGSKVLYTANGHPAVVQGANSGHWVCSASVIFRGPFTTSHTYGESAVKEAKPVIYLRVHTVHDSHFVVYISATLSLNALFVCTSIILFMRLCDPLHSCCLLWCADNIALPRTALL